MAWQSRIKWIKRLLKGTCLFQVFLSVGLIDTILCSGIQSFVALSTIKLISSHCTGLMESSCSVSKTIPDRTSVHIWERWSQRDFCNGANLRHVAPIVIPVQYSLTISSCVSVRMSRYWARGKFGEHERGVRVARGAAECNSSLLSALQASQVLNISAYAQLQHELIVL